MALFVRLCDDWGAPVNSFQKGFFRNLVALVIAGVAWWRATRGRTLDGRRETRDEGDGVLSLKSKVLLLLRATLGTVGIFANFYALSHITIAEGQTLNKTAPFLRFSSRGCSWARRRRGGRSCRWGWRSWASC